jgi:AraC-like DNA-binding protein
LRAIEAIRSHLKQSEVALITCLPRGGLNITQPSTLRPALRRAYGKRFHAEDRTIWEAMRRGRAVSDAHAWPGIFHESQYARTLLHPHGLEHMAAAPIQCPFFKGYPGALVAWRGGQPFSDLEVEHLGQCAAALEVELKQIRARREAARSPLAPPASPFPGRQFIFDGDGRLVELSLDASRPIDPKMATPMWRWVRQWMNSDRSEAAQRLLLADHRGEKRAVRVQPYQSYPALGEGPFIFFCRQPACREWAGIGPDDVQGDLELSRLIPAMHYIYREFADGPNLNQIARRAHLSPFHFHRRFTEAMGMTPKQFLLDCQIDHAKRRLMEGGAEMMRIARECGFTHQSHFTSRFKQATGQTPTGWKRKAIEKGTEVQTGGGTK